MSRSEVYGVPEGAARLPVVPYGRYRRWISEAIALLLAIALAWSLATRPALSWDVVAEYFFDPRVLDGVRVTATLTFYCLVIGFTLAVPLGMMRLSENRVLRWSSLAYVWFFRGTPVLVQLLFWYNLSLLYPRLSLTLPLGGPTFFSVATNDVMTSLTAATVGLGLNLAAYMAEVVRGGILGVDRGQVLCARSLGMSPAQIMGRIVLPQAMRMIIPAAGNYTISMLKYTSLASVVALNELLLTVQTIYSRNFLVIPLLIVASLWYLVLTSILSVGQHFLEKYFGRGYGDSDGKRPVAQ